MRLLLFIALPLALVACSGEEVDEDAAGFVPPTNQTRADYIDRLDRRFARADRNANGAIEADELRGRRAARVQGMDADKDGEVTRGEFVAAGLARFDKADTNRDKTLTGDERAAAGWRDDERGERRTASGT